MSLQMTVNAAQQFGMLTYKLLTFALRQLLTNTFSCAVLDGTSTALAELSRSTREWLYKITYIQGCSILHLAADSEGYRTDGLRANIIRGWNGGIESR